MDVESVGGPSPTTRPRWYEEFWPYFMRCHSDPRTQRLHVLATIWGLGCLLVAFPLTWNGAWLLLAPMGSYPIAWFSHLVFEKNRPAAWTNPYWSFLCDVDMSAMYLAGRLQPEIDRLKREPSARFTLLRRVVHHVTEIVVLAYVIAVIALTWQGRLTFVVPGWR